LVTASARRDLPDRPLMRVSWFFDAGYHVKVGDAEAHNLDGWTEVRRWLESRGKPILADSHDVMTRLYNSELNGCIPEHPGGNYVVALGGENNGFDAEGRADSWDGVAPMARGASTRVLPAKPVHMSGPTYGGSQ
jgi:hypothetical protein